MRKVIAVKRPSSASTALKASTYIKAAEEDDGTDGILDAIDDVADNIEDIQDTVDNVKEDDIDIQLNNNIADHYLAECDKCGGVFISAVVESDQDIDHVSGVCPICGNETDQYLKWIIRDASSDDKTQVSPKEGTE